MDLQSPFTVKHNPGGSQHTFTPFQRVSSLFVSGRHVPPGQHAAQGRQLDRRSSRTLHSVILARTTTFSVYHREHALCDGEGAEGHARSMSRRALPIIIHDGCCHMQRYTARVSQEKLSTKTQLQIAAFPYIVHRYIQTFQSEGFFFFLTADRYPRACRTQLSAAGW